MSELLYFGMGSDHAVQVLNFLEGDHIDGELTDGQRHNLLLAAYKLGQRLHSVPDHLRASHNHTLNNIIEDCIASLDDSPVKRMGQKLLHHPRYGYLVNETPQGLVHYDLHRSNILFRPDDELRILDLGSRVYAPEAFLPASLFMSFFMLQQEDDFSLSNLMSDWPKRLDETDIAILMQARAIIGGTFFQKIISENPNPKPDDIELYEKYLRSMEYLVTIIGVIE